MIRAHALRRRVALIPRRAMRSVPFPGVASQTSRMKLTTPQEVLDFWFGDTIGGALSAIRSRMGQWFGQASTEFVNVQLENEDLIAALRESNNGWDVENDPKAAMAKVIVLDQFSRTVFRGSNLAFAGDETTAATIKSAVDKGWFPLYSPIERLFLVVCLHHSESAMFQELGHELSPFIGTGSDEAVKQFFLGTQSFHSEHYDVVKRFGRFPHRNEALGRQSTEEELMWLQSDTCPAWAKSQQKPK